MPRGKKKDRSSLWPWRHESLCFYFSQIFYQNAWIFISHFVVTLWISSPVKMLLYIIQNESLFISYIFVVVHMFTIVPISKFALTITCLCQINWLFICQRRVGDASLSKTGKFCHHWSGATLVLQALFLKFATPIQCHSLINR